MYTKISNGHRVWTKEICTLEGLELFQAVCKGLEECGFRVRQSKDSGRTYLAEAYGLKIYLDEPLFDNHNDVCDFTGEWYIQDFHRDSQKWKDILGIFSHIRSAWKQRPYEDKQNP